MRAFDKKNGWLYDCVGGPADREMFRIDAGMKPAPEDPPHLQELKFSKHPEGVYRPQLFPGATSVFHGDRFTVWRYVWFPNPHQVAA